MFLPRRLHYFDSSLNREVVELYWNTALFNLSINLAYIFEPIFLYGLGYDLVQIMMFYVVVYTCYALLIVPVTKITSIIGYKKSILISSVIYVCYWLLFFQLVFFSELYYVLPVLFALQKCFFWPPYNADIALNNVRQQRGREVGVLFSLVELASIVGPIIGGFISYKFGFQTMFITSAVLMLISVFPLFLSPEIYTKHTFRFRDFWDMVRKFPQNFFGYWGYAEDLMLMSLWPIFIFIIIPEVFSVGIIITVASLIAVVLMLYLGKLMDRFPKLPVLPIAGVLYGFTWVFRFLGATLVGVIVFEILTRLGKGLVNVPLLFKTYDLAGGKGPDHAIAYAVFYEFSLSIAKIFTALVSIIIIAYTGSIVYTFVMAGALTMLYGLVKK